MEKLSSLLTLGTAAGPSLQRDGAQSSNLLTVNGTHYVVDARRSAWPRVGPLTNLVSELTFLL
jgi:hypothetical protein